MAFSFASAFGQTANVTKTPNDPNQVTATENNLKEPLNTGTQTITANDGGTITYSGTGTINSKTLQTYTPATLPVSTATQAALDLKNPLINYGARAVITVSKATAATDTRGANSKYSTDVPFATIGAAQAAAASGDLIIVSPGDYSAETGAPAAGVTILAQPGAIIDGSFGSTGTTQPKTVYLSAALNSNGGADLESATPSAFGADYTAQIQAILNTASITNPIRVVVDGRYSVTGISVRGYTTIEGLDQSHGFLLRDNSDKPVISNYTLTPGGGDSSQRDHFISLKNLTISGNGDAQSHSTLSQGWICGIRMMGVENVVIENVRIRNARTFACQFANWKNVTVRDSSAEKVTNSNNRDGFKFNGPGQYLFVRGIRVDTSDDSLSLCPNDVLQASTPTINVYGPFAGAGDITDVTIRDIQCISNYGIRLLSSTNLLDRVFINGVRGTVVGQGLIVDNYSEDTKNSVPPGPGNFGRDITISDVSFDRIGSSSYKGCMAFLSGYIRGLTLRNWTRVRGSDDVPTIRVRGTIDRLTLDNLVIDDADPTAVTNQITLDNGYIGTLEIPRLSYYRLGTSTANAIINTSGGNIGSIVAGDVDVTGIDNILNIPSGSSVTSMSWQNVRHNANGGEPSFVNNSTDLIQSYVGSFGGAEITGGSGGFGTRTGPGFGNLSRQPLAAESLILRAPWAAVNGTTLASYTPPTGSAFANRSGTWTINDGLVVASGTPTVLSSVDHYWALSDVGISDHAEIDWNYYCPQPVSGSQLVFPIILFRYVDNSNFSFIVVNVKQNYFQVWDRVAGVNTQCGTNYSNGNISVLADAGMRMQVKISLVGTKVTVALGAMGDPWVSFSRTTARTSGTLYGVGVQGFPTGTSPSPASFGQFSVGQICGDGVLTSEVGDANLPGTLTATALVGPLTGNVTGNITGNRSF